VRSSRFFCRSLDPAVSQYLTEDQHVSGVGRGWRVARCCTLWSHSIVRPGGGITGRVCVSVCGSRSISIRGWFTGTIRWCRSTIGLRVGRSVGSGFATARRDSVGGRIGCWACGMEWIANHLIMISPDAKASAMDDADASASGLRPVEKRTQKALLRLMALDDTNTDGYGVFDWIFYRSAEWVSYLFSHSKVFVD